MWEPPVEMWRRLALGREEYLQRLISTLILDGAAPKWNAPYSPSHAGHRFLQSLDEVSHPDEPAAGEPEPGTFIDEYRLPKLEEHARDGWPDWAVRWPERVWIIELKTEAGSHRDDQLPYYLRLAAAAHPRCKLDLTYITGPMAKPAPLLLPGQRYRHLTWRQVLPLIETAWSRDTRPEVSDYLAMVKTIVTNLDAVRSLAQRQVVLGEDLSVKDPSQARGQVEAVKVAVERASGAKSVAQGHETAHALVQLARSTAADGRQRATGATDPEELEALRDLARASIAGLSPDDTTRFVLPWLWTASQTDGKALTPEGAEFGYELRFSRYRQQQIRP